MLRGNRWYPIWLRCILLEGNRGHPPTTSTAVAPWCLPIPMEQPLDPEQQRRNQTWRSRGARNAKPAPAGEAIAPGRSGRWRPAATGTVHHQHAWWWAFATPTGYSLAAICLLGLFLWQLLVLKRQVPLILGVVSSYRSPLGPVPMATEDRELFRELMRPRSTYDPGTTKVIDISEALRESDAKQWLEEVAKRVSEVRPGGPGGQTLIVYLVAIGAVDRDGHACLVPPRASPRDVGSVDAAWLRVDSLLAALASKRPPNANILLVLDVARPAQAEAIGITDGTFPVALTADMQASPTDRMWVLTSAGPGEIADVGAADGTSAFATSFANAIEGAADTKPWGNGNGQVSLPELATYLADEVNRRSLLQHGLHQTPFILPVPDARNDVGVAWAVRRAPQSQTPPTGPRQANGQIDWLRARWMACATLRERGVREHPLVWAEHEHALLRAERLCFAGNVDHDDLNDQKIAVETTERQLSRMTSELAHLPGFRLARLASGETREINAGWLGQLDAWASDPAGKAVAGSPAAAPCSDPIEWRGRADEAWQRMVMVVRAGALIDRAAWDRWLEIVGPPPPGTIVPFEMHAATLLRHCVPSGAQRQSTLLTRIAMLSQSAAEAAFPDDARADAPLAALAPRAEGDAARRMAFDLALIGDDTSLSLAAHQAGRAEAAYAHTALTGKVVSDAWTTLDQVRAELPWLAIWSAAARRADTSSGASDPQAHPAKVSVDIDWERLATATAALEDLLSRAPSGGDSAAAATETFKLGAEEVRAAHMTLREAYDTTCATLATSAPDSPPTLAAIRAALRIPLVDGIRRIQLLERQSTLSQSLSSQQTHGERERPKPATPDISAIGAGWVAWQGTRVDPLLPALSLRATATSTTTAAGLATTVGTWGQTVRLAVSDFERSAAQPEDADAAAYRRLAPIAASLTARASLPADRVSAAAAQQRRAWHDRLLRTAEDLMDDFFADSTPEAPPWFAAAAGICVKQASVAADDNGASATTSTRLARLETLARNWGEINASPLTVMPMNGDAAEVFFTLHPEAGVPDGDAAVWLDDPSGGGPVGLRPPTDGDAAQRIGVPVHADDERTSVDRRTIQIDRRSASALAASQEGSVAFNAIFRGHRIAVNVPVRPPDSRPPIVWTARPPVAPRVTLKGHRLRRESVSFIFDCSGSMGEQVPGGGRRFDVAKRALVEVLRQMAVSGDWDASLWVYGHRTRWTKQADGSYAAALSEVGERERDTAAREGIVFDAKPGNDVQQVLPMQQLGPGRAHAAEQLIDRLAPAGETPLYLAIASALKSDVSASDPATPSRIVVITDGVNAQTDVQPPTTTSDVLDALAKIDRGRASPVPIDVVAFDFRLGNQEKASLDELAMVAEKSRGSLIHAADGDRLMAALREALKLTRWKVQGADGIPRVAELGQAVELPAEAPPSRRTYDVILDSTAAPVSSTITVSGGEGLELFVAPEGRGLEHSRYDGGTEQRIRDSHDDLPDPTNPQARWFVAVHLPRREGNAVRFPVSIQNGDDKLFSPHPFELWAEVIPLGRAGAQPRVFVDAEYQPHRPVPVIDLLVPDWPQDAAEAEIRLWFTTVPVEPTISIDVADLPLDARRAFPIPLLPGVSIECLLENSGEGRALLRVTERHPPDTSDGLPVLRVRLEPECLRAVHDPVDPTTGTVTHEFEFPLQQGVVPPGTKLTLLEVGQLRQRAVAPEPLRIAVPEE